MNFQKLSLISLNFLHKSLPVLKMKIKMRNMMKNKKKIMKKILKIFHKQNKNVQTVVMQMECTKITKILLNFVTKLTCRRTVIQPCLKALMPS